MQRLTFMFASIFLGLICSVTSTIAQEDAQNKTLFTNVNVFDGKNEKFAEILVEQVAQTLEVADEARLQEELAELQLLEFCQSAIAQVASRITPKPER